MQTAKSVIVVGAGPAGLMAAEIIRAAGHHVDVYETKPTACRKLLLAGIGGLNITHSEPYAQFIQRYYDKSAWLEPSIKQFDADALREWIHDLGITTFIGSSGRVFPLEMKAAPLVRSWLKRLRESGIKFHMRHRLIELDQLNLKFEHEYQTISVCADAVVLALGGASWAKLGSDGAWQAILAKSDVNLQPLQSANCGFLSNWSKHLSQKFSGSPLKNIAFKFHTINGDLIQQRGECIVSHYGMEGSLIYAYSKHLRDAINQTGQAELLIDLLPDISEAKLISKLSTPQGKDSFSKYLKRTTGLSGLKAALIYERSDTTMRTSQKRLANLIKNLPVTFFATRPIDEAISSAGGVCEQSLTAQMMLKKVPGVFCAGEMLDWEAPTGGYLLTACFATGKTAGNGVIKFLKDTN